MSNATLVRIGDDAYSALALSGMTYGSEPESDDSPGAVFLRAVAVRYLSERDEIRENEELISPAANDLAGLQSSAVTWAVAADLRLHADAADGALDYGLWAEQLHYENPHTFKTERVWAVRKDKLTSALEWWLYETASALLHALRKADLESNPEQEDEG